MENKRYGLIGGKLGHSYSKIIHEKIADYSYDLIPLTPEEFTDFMERKDFAAINVTIPYKKSVIPYLYSIDGVATKIGAVNTIVNKEGKLYGYNTDYYGFLYTLKKNNIEITGKKVLVLGNGGAAQAVIAAVNSLSPASLYIVKYKVEEGTITYEEAAEKHSDADVIINTSAKGMYPNVDETPMDTSIYKDLSPYTKLSAVVDIIYNPAVTKLLSFAEAKNIKAVNGLEMLVAQAVYACEYFLDTKLDEDIIDKIYNEIKQK
ncbi:MAG: shikimate dehydrogenase family protein [Lachnospiraceae bacterium]